jgi:hypothetical protein
MITDIKSLLFVLSKTTNASANCYYCVMSKMGLFCICCLLLSNFSSLAQPSHQMWDELLKKNVSASGAVDYSGFLTDSVKLNSYLKVLSENPPNEQWSINEIKAFWINAYNAFTVKLILNHYPVKSIKDIAGSIYKVNTAWDIKFINIGNETLDLNNIEHKKLRGQFNDPRIHMAVNCASYSCPKLRNEAYKATTLENQLNDQSRDFLMDKRKNDLSNLTHLKLNKIFSWYSGDFKKDGNTLESFIEKHTGLEIPENAKIDYLDYNWSLNSKQ